MSKSKQAAKHRLWISRLRRLPQGAEREFHKLFHRIPQKVRFLLVSAIFSLFTTLAASHYPLTVLPEYRIGEIVASDVVVPATLMVEDEARAGIAPPRFKRNPVLLHAGEEVTR